MKHLISKHYKTAIVVVLSAALGVVIALQGLKMIDNHFDQKASRPIVVNSHKPKAIEKKDIKPTEIKSQEPNVTTDKKTFRPSAILSKSIKKISNTLFKPSRPIWEVLSENTVTYNDELGQFNISYTQDTKDLVGKKLVVKGFIMPLEASEKFTHFLLTKSTPSCFFCPPENTNETIDIYLTKAITWDENMIAVKGVFELNNNLDLGLFFKIDNAVIVKNK